MKTNTAALAAIEFAAKCDCPQEFLTEWMHGDWDSIRNGWPGAPEACFQTQDSADDERNHLDRIFSRAASIYGVVPQVTTAMEECGELIVVLNKFFIRSQIGLNELAREVADVELMCHQIRVLIGHELVDLAKHEKLERFAKRMSPNP